MSLKSRELLKSSFRHTERRLSQTSGAHVEPRSGQSDVMVGSSTAAVWRHPNARGLQRDPLRLGFAGPAVLRHSMSSSLLVSAVGVRHLKTRRCEPPAAMVPSKSLLLAAPVLATARWRQAAWLRALTVARPLACKRPPNVDGDHRWPGHLPLLCCFYYDRDPISVVGEIRRSGSFW
jgi:hypothetical protein